MYITSEVGLGKHPLVQISPRTEVCNVSVPWIDWPQLGNGVCCISQYHISHINLVERGNFRCSVGKKKAN